MNLLKELASVDLKKSDGSDAGKNDVVQKMGSGQRHLSLMRNAINNNEKVSGSDVANYLEKAAQLNDEVDAVLYGLETDDGQVVKVYVNASQADAFEKEMRNLLGVEDDIEEAINRLAYKFDIVDVIWPNDDSASRRVADGDVKDLDMGSGLSPDEDEEMEVIASVDDEDEDQDKEDEDEEEDEEEDQDEEEEDEEEDQDEEEEDEEDLGSKTESYKHKKKYMRSVENKVKSTKEGQGATMSIGNSFLKRVLNERVIFEEEGQHDLIDDVKVQLDGQTRALMAKFKYKMPKRILALFAMIGIPGVKLKTENIESRIEEAADMLRRRASVRNAFMEFFDALATAMGKKVSVKQDTVSEAKMKRGNYLQKMLETVLVELGLPEELVMSNGPAIVGTALFKASKVIEDNADAKQKLRMLAVRMGIQPAEVLGTMQDAKVAESIDPAGADTYADAVMRLVAALGVPDSAFAKNARATLAKAFRAEREKGNVAMLLPLVKRMIIQVEATKARFTED